MNCRSAPREFVPPGERFPATVFDPSLKRSIDVRSPCSFCRGHVQVFAPSDLYEEFWIYPFLASDANCSSPAGHHHNIGFGQPKHVLRQNLAEPCSIGTICSAEFSPPSSRTRAVSQSDAAKDHCVAKWTSYNKPSFLKSIEDQDCCRHRRRHRFKQPDARPPTSCRHRD